MLKPSVWIITSMYKFQGYVLFIYILHAEEGLAQNICAISYSNN